MDRATDGPRLLMVGLDGACLPVLERLFEFDAIPTIERLVGAGPAGSLQSQLPPWTASAWPSIYTGVNPGKHGVFDFLAFDGYDWDVVNATHVRARPIWELLSEHGYTSIVVNVPVTHPPRAFDGALIPGMTAPEDPACHPAGLLAEIEAEIGPYRIYPQSGPEPNGSIDSYERTVVQRGAATRYLLDQFAPDFAFVQFQVTDSVFHERPGERGAIEAVYRAVDRELERILSQTTPETTVLLSDHGIGPVRGHEFRVNEFLRDEGALVARQGGDGMPTWSRAWENDLLDGEDAGAHEPSAVEQLLEAAARVGLTTQRVANALDLVGLKEPIGRRVPNDLIRAASEQVDFEHSDAYVRSKSELGVRINLDGREPAGTVPVSEYESVRSDLIDALEAVRTPDDEPMFDAVEPRNAVFSGPNLEKGPDIVLVPTAFDNAIVADLAGSHFGEPIEPWNHKRTGMLAASGQAVDGPLPSDAHVFDVAPTICSIFDVPVDDEMDGDVLPFVEASDRQPYPAYDPEPIVETEHASVEDRLSDLGYL